MTDLKETLDFPSSLVEEYREATTQEPVYLHNWLYSVVPVSVRVEEWRADTIQVDYPLFAYLTGYCRNCNRAFSMQIPTNGYSGYVETQMDIPKEGCVAPR